MIKGNKIRINRSIILDKQPPIGRSVAGLISSVILYNQ